MEKIVSKIAALGVPGLVLLIAISATGLTGAAAITSALAALGPFEFFQCQFPDLCDPVIVAF